MKSKSVQSTSTTDGSMLKLGNDLWCDVELIATKVSSQMCRKWKTISEDSVETDCTRLTFPRQSRGNQKIFKLFCLWKSSSTVLLANLPSFHRENLSPKGLKFHFSEVNDCLRRIEQKTCKEKTTLVYVSSITFALTYVYQHFAVKNNEVYLVWPQNSTWAIRKWKSSTQKISSLFMYCWFQFMGIVA